MADELLMRLTALLAKHKGRDSVPLCLNSKPVFLHYTMLPLEIREEFESTIFPPFSDQNNVGHRTDQFFPSVLIAFAKTRDMAPSSVGAGG